MFELYCRIYQMVLRLVSKVMPWRIPVLIEGQGSITKLADIVKKEEIERILIVTDKSIVSLGIMNSLISSLKLKNINFFIYDDTVVNPTIENIEEAIKIYYSNSCQGIIAFGGGSAMDCAKAVGARIARPQKNIGQMRGQMKVRKKIPLLFAVPTTSGTGSEATIAAVITDSQTHEKYAINDMALIPHYAILDPLLTIGLPPHLTASTGMDALTHAIEAYIGNSNTRETKEYSKEAIKLIFENILEAYKNGDNIVARENMQRASYLAGLAFTRAYVGYVHAIAHSLGGFYGVPHGLANAIILPYVLDYYGSSVHVKLAELAEFLNMSKQGDSIEEKANRVINLIKELNIAMNISNKIDVIKNDDINKLAEKSVREANPLYPVPKILSKADLSIIIKQIELGKI